MRRRFPLFLLVGFIPLISVAQETPPTQYFSAPLTLNPANTGLINGDIRAAVNYAQSKGYYHYAWADYPSVQEEPDRIVNMSVDGRVLQGLLPKGDALGVGIALIAGNYCYNPFFHRNTRSAGVSLAYHKKIGRAGLHYVSAGGQAAMVKKEMFDGRVSGVYDHPVSYKDYSAGIMYTGALSPYVTVYAGAARYHITQPWEHKFNWDRLRLYSHTIINVGSVVRVGKTISIYTNVAHSSYGYRSWQERYYSKPMPTWQMSAYGRLLLNPASKRPSTGDVAVYAGGQYIHKDHIAPYVGFEVANMRFGISYAKDISNGRSNYEGYQLSLVYTGKYREKHGSGYLGLY